MNEELHVWAHRLARQPGTYLSLRHPVTRSLRAQWHVDIEDDAVLPQVAQAYVQMHEMGIAPREAFNNTLAAYRKPPWRVL